jgi:ribosome-associated protein
MTEQNRDSSLELATWIAQSLDRKGGHDIVVLETRSWSTFADYFVIATGTSDRHMETLLETPCKELRHSGHPPHSTEGFDTHWMLADMGDVVLHIFDNDSRKTFDLEGFWKKAPRVQWQKKRGPSLTAHV